MKPYKTEAATFCAAVKRIAESEEALENLESYLSAHFAEWLSLYANEPEALATEMDCFSRIF